MRGAAMSLTAAASGFVVFLLSVSVIQGQDGWGVTYTSTQICAVKGSTVNIPCSYTYPSAVGGVDTTVEQRFWFIQQFVDLTTDSEYSGRVQYHSENKDCTLRISDLRERDSAVYKFRFITNQGGNYVGYPGVTLSVTGLQVQVRILEVYEFSILADLKCQSSCPLPGHPSYIWYKNGQNIQGQTSDSYSASLDPADSFSCAVRGHEDFPSPSVYGPKLPSVSVSPSAEIVEGSSVTLACSSDANPAAKYTYWFKEKPVIKYLSEGPQLVFSSIQSSDSGQYSCTAENELGEKTSQYKFINVKYGPKLPSVSVSPSAEIVEGSSVTLTCSSDANPAANYTWYKENQTLLQGPEGRYYFSSIRSEDRGNYYCKSENQFGQIKSSSLSVDVQYGPKLPSVSVSPSAEIVEGSSVTLTCSSDANPAANYTWYKENEDSPKASGQIFTITDVRPEHSGNYYCEAQNRRGSQNSTLHLSVVAGNSTMIMNIIRLTVVVLMLIPLLLLSLWARKKKNLSSTTGPHGPVEIELDSCPAYENISDTAAQTEDPEEQEDLV
ncbi:sialoadhesin-like isoform X2 [Perca flavescens]|uniref:sialoadhesin-like isoform X2 n=1 Tax=Perca flavescens TaxID=8167 RepID=UPI00106E6B62|nr:sialoadhesin-like isoform X2 [Perca flavescens]